MFAWKFTPKKRRLVIAWTISARHMRLVIHGTDLGLDCCLDSKNRVGDRNAVARATDGVCRLALSPGRDGLKCTRTLVGTHHLLESSRELVCPQKHGGPGS